MLYLRFRYVDLCCLGHIAAKQPSTVQLLRPQSRIPFALLEVRPAPQITPSLCALLLTPVELLTASQQTLQSSRVAGWPSFPKPSRPCPHCSIAYHPASNHALPSPRQATTTRAPRTTIREDLAVKPWARLTAIINSRVNTTAVPLFHLCS